MGAQVIALPAAGRIDYTEQGAGWKRGVIRQRVPIALNSAYSTLGVKLPEAAKVVWASAKNVSAVTIVLDTPTATGTVGFVLTQTDITSLSTTAAVTTDYLLKSDGAVQSGGVVTLAQDASNRGIENNKAQSENLADPRLTTDGGVNIHLVPSVFTTAANATVSYLPDTATATNGIYFSTATNVDVEIWFDEYEEEPNNA
jgi:hypothetical protein